MTAWLFMFTPIAVLIIVLLMAFNGCSGDTFVSASGPTYHDTVKQESSLVAYWRLGEPANTPVPSTGTAKDETGNHPGNYNKAVITADPLRHSIGAPGNISLGNNPGLLESQPTDTSISVNGGFVEVPFDGTLNANPFTFEAWVKPDFAGANAVPGNYYCLVESTAPAGGVQKKLGFGLYVGPQNPGKVNPVHQWQVWMGDGQKFAQVGLETDQLFDNQLTFLAVTFDPTLATNNLILYLYYPNTGQDLTMASIAPLQATVTTFKPNNNPGGGSFLIGVGRNLFPNVLNDPIQLQPFLYAFPGKIQEAAFYSKALSMDVLSQHEMTGGNI